jgi:uncharacterized protein (UPF0248 family)
MKELLFSRGRNIPILRIVTFVRTLLEPVIRMPNTLRAICRFYFVGDSDTNILFRTVATRKVGTAACIIGIVKKLLSSLWRQIPIRRIVTVVSTLAERAIWVPRFILASNSVADILFWTIAIRKIGTAAFGIRLM